LQAIQQATGFKNAEVALADLNQFASVSAFADAFIRDNAQIDILVYNAAAALFPYSLPRMAGKRRESVIFFSPHQIVV
jgi:NAD(P)-dependent dehydrogenase (short-subunit alcohol dehydrogenase family)